jgi:hypothetical protein
VYLPNGTVVKETELVRPMFGRARDRGVVKLDLVASIYFRKGGFARDQDATQMVTGERSNSSSANLTAVATVSNSTSLQAYSTDLGRASLRPKSGKNHPEGWTPPVSSSGNASSASPSCEGSICRRPGTQSSRLFYRGMSCGLISSPRFVAQAHMKS